MANNLVFEQQLSGFSSGFFGKKPATYRVTVFLYRNKWRTLTKINDNKWSAQDFPSQYEAEKYADEMCTRISRGEQVL